MQSNTRKFLLACCGILIISYAFIVLLVVQFLPDLGLRTAFSTELRSRPIHFELSDQDEFHPKDRMLRIGTLPIRRWADVLNAPWRLRQEWGPVLEQLQQGELAKLPPEVQVRKSVGDEWVVVPPDKVKSEDDVSLWVRLEMQRDTGDTYLAWCKLGQVPFKDLVPSLLWFLLKASLLSVGAWVWWKKPDEPAAEQFYLMCLVAVGAYIGGYHWSHLVVQPALLLVFIICGMLLPVVSLHFYLIFPRPKTWLREHPRRSFAVVYGIPLAFMVVIVGLYVRVRWWGPTTGDQDAALEYLRLAIYGYFGIAATWYLASVVSLIHSYRTVPDATERNQVKSILLGALLALIPISYSLYLAIYDSNLFSAGGATWPMFSASAILTIAYAVSITRYRLMELDQVISSSMDYFVASFLAAALYYAVVFVGTLIFNRYIASPRLSEALAVSTTALLLLLVLDQARGRVKRFLDRRFTKQKTQLDRTLQRMGQAIEQLVDPPVLALKFLNATTELLGIAQGSVFLRNGEPATYKLAGFQGSAPSLGELPPGSPLIDLLSTGKTAAGQPNPYAPLTLAQKQLRNLGGEFAQPVMHEECMLAFLVLGPKDPPYRPEDSDLLAAFAQIAALALASAEGHRTIDQLNQELRGKVQKISEQQRRILALQSQLHRQVIDRPASKPEEPNATDPATSTDLATIPPASGIVGTSTELQHLLGMIKKVAATDAVVLIHGESGTGKELLARAVHETSPRAGKPYVKVHCAALSPSLLESELFGHVKGAYTGAHKDKVGRFELAHGGTLFLDEIGDISLEVQTKLLRVLQERTIERVGSSDSIQVDVRIITATHQNLEALIRQGRFREDLFYRLNVFPVIVPALRQRTEDIVDLARHFMQQSALRCKKNLTGIDDDVLILLKSYPWPGNIRQLENVIERAVVIAEGPTITLSELSAELFQPVEDDDGPVAGFIDSDLGEDHVTRPVSPQRRERLRKEREELVHALAITRGNKAEAARSLGIARSTLVSRLKKFGLV